MASRQPFTRRTFLKAGVAGTCVLLFTHALDRSLYAQPVGSGSLDLKILANKDADCIAALALAILRGTLPDDAVARNIAVNEVVEAFDRTVAGLSPPVQREVEELLSLLTFSITRRLICGLSKPWHEASTEEVAAFLDNWRQSRFALLQQGYQALVRVMTACWYGNPLSWQRIGYGGPPYARELGLQ